MTILPRSLPVLATLLALAGASPGEDAANITIKTLKAQMKYDVTEIHVNPGQKVSVTLKNEDDMPHNICFFQPGTDVVAAANKQMDKPDEALKRNWIPDDPRLLAHSKPVQPGESDMVSFTAPRKAGEYPFVCTFPGHAAIMQGKMMVGEGGEKLPGLTDLKFALYLGLWDSLPEFAKLKPHREGDVKDNLLQIKVDDYKNEFGLVFTGKLNAPKDGEYIFAISSDDGSRLIVDGKMVVEDDDIHPATNIREGSVKLKKGPHTFRFEYFQARGNAELYVAWGGQGFETTPLSKELKEGMRIRGKVNKNKGVTSGIPLVVAQEPVIYRNFISGAGNRGIGVGYPGNANIAWSAEAMNLAIAWRGAFMDAGRHWTGRGGGHQPPLGYDVFRPADLSPPFAVVSKGSAWPGLSKDGRAEGYTWRGYELDVKRFPIFHYEWQGVKVSDRCEVVGDALVGEGKLVRTLKLEGKIPAGAVFRVASAPKITPQGGGFVVEPAGVSAGAKSDAKFNVSAEGAAFNGKDITLPARPEIVVTYSWPNPQTPHAHAH